VNTRIRKLEPQNTNIGYIDGFHPVTGHEGP